MNRLIIWGFVKEAVLGRWASLGGQAASALPFGLLLLLLFLGGEVGRATKWCSPALAAVFPSLVCAGLHVGGRASLQYFWWPLRLTSPSSFYRQNSWGTVSLSFLTPASCVWRSDKGFSGGDAKTRYDRAEVAGYSISEYGPAQLMQFKKKKTFSERSPSPSKHLINQQITFI